MKEYEEFSGYTVPACSKCPHYPGDEEACMNAMRQISDCREVSRIAGWNWNVIMKKPARS